MRWADRPLAPAPIASSSSRHISACSASVGSTPDFARSKPIAHTPLRRSYDERVLVIGEAAGQVKATTGGGIYYGLLAARLASDTIPTAFASVGLTAQAMSRYERR